MVWLKNVDLAKKIVLALVLAGFTSIVLVGGISYKLGQSANVAAVERDLSSGLQAKKAQTLRYQGGVIGDLEFLENMRDTGPMIKVLTNAFNASEEKDGKGSVKNAYVDGSPFPVGEREFLDDADDGSKYSAMHKRLHPTMREFLYSRGYYDIFLINTDGQIIYSVYKEADFQTNLIDGDYADSGLATVFKQSLEAKPGQYSFVDFEPYAPSNGAQAAFVSMPIFVSPGFGQPEELIGVVAVQLPIKELQGAILAEQADNSIQSYIVGKDGVLRTDVSATETFDVGEVSIDMSQISGMEEGFVHQGGVLGDDSIIAFTTIKFLGQPWYVISEERSTDAHHSDIDLRNNILKTSIPVMVLIGVVAWFVGRGIAQPVIGVGQAMGVMKQGDLSTVIPGTNRGDEIGAMARNTDEFRQQLADARDEDARRVELDRENANARAQMLKDLEQRVGAVVHAVSSGRFEERVDADFEDEAFRNLGVGVNEICDVVRTFVSEVEDTIGKLAEGDLTAQMVGQYSGRFSEVSDSINETAVRLGGLVAGIKKTGEEMNLSIQQVAEGSEDLARRAESQAASLEETAATMDKISETIKLNAQSSLKAEELASDTRDQAVKGHGVVDDAVKAMGEIEESSQKITDIISVIDSIAFQTNLLALNAAVEAARAGDAGKGFAVVASEVRTLAQRSSEAARDITDLITVSSEKVSDGVTLVNATGIALNDITTAVTAFSETISNISAASQEQSMGVSEISGSISHMDEMTQNNATLAESSASAAKSLTRHADQMSNMIAVFTISELHSSAPDVTYNKGPELATRPQPDRHEVDVAEDSADQDWADVAASANGIDQSQYGRVAGEDWSDF